MPFFGDDNNGYNSNNSNWSNNSDVSSSREGEFDSSFSFGMEAPATVAKKVCADQTRKDIQSSLIGDRLKNQLISTASDFDRSRQM